VESNGRVVVLAHTLIDGSGGQRDDAAVLVADGAIEWVGARGELQVPPEATIIDLGDRTVMPGMVDAHMHFLGVPTDQLNALFSEGSAYRALRAAGEARKMVEAGVTSARCLGSSIGPSLQRAFEEGHVLGPRLVAAGEFICATGGTWDHVDLPLIWMEAQGMIADGADEVRKAVRRRIREGASVIKLGLSKGEPHGREHVWGDDPGREILSYRVEEVQAGTEEAHRHGLKVSAHCIGDEAVRTALDGGVDVIEHGFGVNNETRSRLAASPVIVVSTFSQIYFHLLMADELRYAPELVDTWRRHMDVMRSDFAKGLAMGVRYALGTDLVGFPTHPQNRAAKEFALAVEAGLSPMGAIVAGTSTGAEVLGLAATTGTLVKGKQADLIAMPGSPIEDIGALEKVDFVMLGGSIVRQPTDLTGPRAKPQSLS
jgi:imidazolonepropionase-like amidohydrolase